MLVIDANNSVVLDYVEEVALEVRPGVLAACPGDGNIIGEVTEVRTLELQKTGKRKNNRRKARPKRRKEKKKNTYHVLQKAGFRRKRRTIKYDDEECKITCHIAGLSFLMRRAQRNNSFCATSSFIRLFKSRHMATFRLVKASVGFCCAPIHCTNEISLFSYESLNLARVGRSR